MMAASEVVLTRGMKNQVRIRGPKPDVVFRCKSLEELETHLTGHIANCKQRPVPGTVYAQFIFDGQVTFLVHDLADGIRDHFPHLQNHSAEDGPGRVAVPEAVAQTNYRDAKSKLKRQRAVGRLILKSIQKVDHFHYFEKEAWDTKHEDGYRFKYLCRDSVHNEKKFTNKTRKSDVGLPGSNAVTAANDAKGAAAEDAAPCERPPAQYECKGSVFVKFSSSQQVVDVVYQHMTVHDETNKAISGFALAEPYLQNGTSHEDSGDPMDTGGTVACETAPSVAPTSIPTTDGAAAPSKGKKRKRNSKPQRAVLIEADSSDPDLDDDDGVPDEQAPPLPLVSPGWVPDPGDGDLYRQSVVTRVPGLKAQVKQAARQNFRASSPGNDSSASGSAYEGKNSKKKGGAGGSATKPKAAAAKVSGGDSDSRPTTRKRTKTGCWTCRQRKLKCDENRPQCSQCARSRPPRECSFPEDEQDSGPPGVWS